MKDKGFTLIELVVVIVILGILSATALPKFVNLTEDAHLSVEKSVKGSFDGAAKQLRLKWLARGKPSTLTINGNSISMSAEGYPIGSTTDTAGCIEIWNKIMDTDMSIIPISNDAIDDWSAYGSAGNSISPHACAYSYHHGEVFTPGQTPAFSYTPSTGSIVVFNFD